MQKITTNLWFDGKAEEAVNFYTSIFKDSKVGNILRYGKEGFEFHGMPEGTVMTIDFEIMGQHFVALNGGPQFKFNESISLFVYCGSEERINILYQKLAEGGSVNMPLGKYDWSPKYAWVKDRFGVSWQLDIEDVNSPQKIVPSILFVNEKFAKVKGAMNYYASIFPSSKIIMEVPWDKSMNFPEGTLLFAQAKLNNYLFNAMSGGSLEHNFDFNESISFIISCENQAEVDYYWESLGENGDENAKVCGWLKDKFGVSWQIVPSVLYEMLNDKQKAASVMTALLKMKKLDIKKLIEAANE